MQKKFVILKILIILFFVSLAPLLIKIDPRLIVISLIGAGISPLLDPLKDYWEMKQKEARIREKNAHYLKEIKKFLESKTAISMQNIAPSNEEKSRLENYEIFVNKNFPSLNNTQKDSLLLATLCYIYTNSSGRESSIIYDDITDLSRKLIPYETTISDSTKIFLSAYSHLLESPKKYNIIEEIFELEPNSTDKYFEELRWKFSQKFQIDYFVRIITEKLNTQQELFEALRFIVERGELDEYNLSKESLTRIYQELYREGIQPTTLLLIGNKIPEELKAYITKCPGFTGSAPRSRNIPGVKPVGYSMYLFKPTEYFRTIDDFYEKRIEPTVKKEKKNTLLRIFPLDFINSWKKEIRPEKWSDEMVNCYQTLNYFQTGLKYSTTPIFDVLTKNRVEINKLLSIIPFTICLPEIRDSERKFILKNYQKIKEKCGVTMLQDWSYKTPTEIVKTMLSIGKPEYSDLDKEILWKLDKTKRPTKNQIEKRLMQLSEKVIEVAKKYSKPFEHNKIKDLK